MMNVKFYPQSWESRPEYPVKYVYKSAKSTDTEERHKTNRISFQHKTFVVITHKDCDVTRKSLVKYIKGTNSEQKDLSEELIYEKF